MTVSVKPPCYPIGKNGRSVISIEKTIRDCLDKLKVGRKQTYKNLTLFPLLSSYSMGLDYLLLDEALDEGLIEVTEISKEGSVCENAGRG